MNDLMQNEVNNNREQRPDVILSVLKLMRSMRRRPPHPRGSFPPAVERFIQVLAENDQASSREMCELMDIRPSTMSEMIARMEDSGIVERENDPGDRRISRLKLTEEGWHNADRIRESKRAESNRMSACFTDEEARVFCALCDRLSTHLENLEGEAFNPKPFGDHCPPPPFGRHGEFPPPPPFGAPGEFPPPMDPDHGEHGPYGFHPRKRGPHGFGHGGNMGDI